MILWSWLSEGSTDIWLLQKDEMEKTEEPGSGRSWPPSYSPLPGQANKTQSSLTQILQHNGNINMVRMFKCCLV